MNTKTKLKRRICKTHKTYFLYSDGWPSTKKPRNYNVCSIFLGKLDKPKCYITNKYHSSTFFKSIVESVLPIQWNTNNMQVKIVLKDNAIIIFDSYESISSMIKVYYPSYLYYGKMFYRKKYTRYNLLQLKES